MYTNCVLYFSNIEKTTHQSESVAMAPNNLGTSTLVLSAPPVDSETYRDKTSQGVVGVVHKSALVKSNDGNVSAGRNERGNKNKTKCDSYVI